MLSNKDLYKNLLIEIRPRLQSINVFINLRNTLKKVQISISNNDIIINSEYALPCKKVEILPESLNCLQITDKNISFRFSTTTSDSFGTFRTELLQLKKENVSNVDATFLNKSHTYDIECANCSQVFCKSIQFDRILPLPSDHAEPSDWFCHDHTNNGNRNLDPKYNDVFYTICYAHVNSKLLSGILKTSTNVICKRCLSWLGVIVNENCLKIWFNTVCFNDGIVSHKTQALLDTYLTLRCVLKESLLNSARIVLKCRLSESQEDYVLLWILEKKLNVITDSVEEGLRDSFVAKVLFKFQSGCNETVNQWINDVAVASICISKLMMVELLQHLYDTNKLIPQSCNMSNDFYVSYLSLYFDE